MYYAVSSDDRLLRIASKKGVIPWMLWNSKEWQRRRKKKSNGKGCTPGKGRARDLVYNSSPIFLDSALIPRIREIRTRLLVKNRATKNRIPKDSRAPSSQFPIPFITLLVTNNPSPKKITQQDLREWNFINKLAYLR